MTINQKGKRKMFLDPRMIIYGSVYALGVYCNEYGIIMCHTRHESGG